MNGSSLPPFMTSVEAFDVEDLLEAWRWLAPPEATPLFLSVFGDWVLGAPDGSLCSMEIDFQLDPDANSMAAFTAKDPTDREAAIGWRQTAERLVAYLERRTPWDS